MSDPARPEIQAFRELEALVRKLGDELATFRNRAFAAEERLREIDSVSDHPDPPHVRERIRALEQENASLRTRLDAATSRTKSVLDRIQFLRQQAQVDGR